MRTKEITPLTLLVLSGFLGAFVISSPHVAYAVGPYSIISSDHASSTGNAGSIACTVNPNNNNGIIVSAQLYSPSSTTTPIFTDTFADTFDQPSFDASTSQGNAINGSKVVNVIQSFVPAFSGPTGFPDTITMLYGGEPAILNCYAINFPVEVDSRFPGIGSGGPIGATNFVTSPHATGGNTDLLFNSIAGFEAFGTPTMTSTSPLSDVSYQTNGVFGASLDGWIDGFTGSSLCPATTSSGTFALVCTAYYAVGGTGPAPPPVLFSSGIKNLDCGNCMIADGKYYQFFAEVSSNWVNPSDSGIPFQQVQFNFNDGFHSIVVGYDNTTGKTFINSGAQYIQVGQAFVKQGISLGRHVMNVTIPVALRTTIFDVAAESNNSNRSVVFFAQLQNGHSHFTKIINRVGIINQGGGAATILKGNATTSINNGVGNGVFSSNAWANGSIATNATFYGLQQYSTQFSIILSKDNLTSQADPFLFQPFGFPSCTSAPGNDYSFPGDWRITVTWWVWNNNTQRWSSLQHVLIYGGIGCIGGTDQWTNIFVEWFNGNDPHPVLNGTITGWPETSDLSGTTPGQLRIYLDMWLSKENASTIHGGHIASYYTGMHQTGYLWWASWSPVFANQSASTIYDRNFNGTTAQAFTCSKIEWNVTRTTLNLINPGSPVYFARPKSYHILVQGFDVQKFLTTLHIDRDGGVGTPAFSVTAIPNLPVNSFLGPIVNALASLANWIWGVISGALNQIWLALGNQFPWFTGFFSWVYSGITAFFGLLQDVVPILLGGLNFIGSIFSFVLVPIGIIQSTYAGIAPLFSWVPFGGLSTLITIFILLFFVVRYMTALNEGNFGLIWDDARKVWKVTNTILYWSYQLISTVINNILGLIP